MKNNSMLKKQYSGVIRNIYKKIIIAILLAIVIVYILRNLLRGYIGNLITRFICFYYKIDDWDYASFLYFTKIRQYYSLIIVAAVIIFFAIILRIVLQGFKKYFDEILSGIDLLSSEETEAIVMSREIAFVGEKLQSVKNELIKRKKEKEKYTQIALDKALRLETLMNEFFEITRSHAQTMVLEKNEVDLAYMLEQVVDETYPLLKKSDKKVEVLVSEEIRMEMDSSRMARVFTNLIKNACHYSEGEIIRVICKKENDYVQITFENKGDVPEEQLERLFDKFYRLDGARQTKTGGAGLGLAISKEIIVAHKGTIKAECREGIFRIIVTLPIIK